MRWPVVLLLAVFPTVAFGDGEPKKTLVEETADEVLAAWRAKDVATVRAHAERDMPDPWLVADELLGRGEHAAAEQLARAAPRKAVEALPAYVASQRGARDDPAARRAYADAVAAVLARDGEAALRALDGVGAGAPPVVAVNLVTARAYGFWRLQRREDASSAFGTAARGAEELGWWGRAAAALHESADLSFSLSDYAAALTSWTRSLELREALGERLKAAQARANVGNAHAMLGDYALALANLESAFREKEALDDRAGAIRTLGDIGNVHYSMGSYARALGAFEKALEGAQARNDKTEIARTLGNVGNVYDAIGEHARALEVYERSLRMKQESGNRFGAALTLANIGVVHHALGDYARALDAHRRALSEHEALGRRSGIANALANVGLDHAALGDHAAALEMLEKARETAEGAGDRAQAAEILGHIGREYTRIGDLATSIALLERALAAAEEVGDRTTVVATLGNLADAHLRRGDPAAAVAAARRAVGEVSGVVRGLGDEQGAMVRARYSGLFDRGVLAGLALRDLREVSFFLESGRAGALLESLRGAEKILAPDLPEPLRGAEREARAKATAALRAYQAALEVGNRREIQARREDRDAAQGTLKEAVQRIQREAKAVASVLYPKAAELEHVRSWLRAGEALVLYSLLPEDAMALVVTAEGARIASLGKTADVVSACEALLAPDGASDRPSLPAEAAERLRALLVAPLALDARTKRLLVSPDGALSYVPYGMLAPDREVAAIASGTILGLLREGRGERGAGILAVGDPDYGARFDPAAIEVYRGGERLAPLPGTREEAKAVGDVTLLGAQASESGVREALTKRSRWRGVHFACHGLVEAEQPTLSSLALTPSGDDDGFMTALDVLRMRIPADLVVLSACDTARGKIVEGEGIIGLTRAFMFAGAPSVICSLWKVDDEATRALMVKFYELWNPKRAKGIGAAAALKAAQEHVRSQEKWKHPYYWAAWVLWGLPE
jgi:tetratricopeptide (TPR) repeat protein